MSRHNRRRSRGGSKFATSQYTRDDFEVHSILPAEAPAAPHTRQADLTARHWHNRYLAWQRRDQRQREEKAKIEAERQRKFGGEPGDDDSLCYRMMEYFEGLDYIEA